MYCGLYPIQPGRPISRLETDVKTRKNDLKVDIELCASNPYFDICQQTSDKAIVTEACFLKKPVSCRSCMTHAELPCRLPFASPPLSSVPPLISGPSLSASPTPSPASPLLPTVLKSFEAQMWADSGYFLSRHDSFMCHKRSIHIG